MLIKNIESDHTINSRAPTMQFFFILFSIFLFSSLSLQGYQATREILENECDVHKIILIKTQLSEEEAKEIISFLQSKGITAIKRNMLAGREKNDSEIFWNIYAPLCDAVEVITLLDKAGLPKRKKSRLFEEFMRREREQPERYGSYASRAEDLEQEIERIPGVLDAEILIGPIKGNNPTGEIECLVYIRHTGVLDDPNGQYAEMIKKNLLQKISGLTMKNITILAERESDEIYKYPEQR